MWHWFCFSFCNFGKNAMYRIANRQVAGAARWVLQLSLSKSKPAHYYSSIHDVTASRQQQQRKQQQLLLLVRSKATSCDACVPGIAWGAVTSALPRLYVHHARVDVVVQLTLHWIVLTTSACHSPAVPSSSSSSSSPSSPPPPVFFESNFQDFSNGVLRVSVVACGRRATQGERASCVAGQGDAGAAAAAAGTGASETAVSGCRQHRVITARPTIDLLTQGRHITCSPTPLLALLITRTVSRLLKHPPSSILYAPPPNSILVVNHKEHKNCRIQVGLLVVLCQNCNQTVIDKN